MISPRLFCLVLSLTCIASCSQCPRYELAHALAQDLVQLPKETHASQARAKIINESLLSARMRDYLPPQTKVDIEKIKISVQEMKGVAGYAYYRYNETPPYYTDVTHVSIKMNKVKPNFYKGGFRTSNFMGHLSERSLQLWHDMDYNGNLVHELAHHYFAQRYPYICSKLNEKLYEGYCEFMRMVWLERFYNYSLSTAYSRTNKKYAAYYKHFTTNYINDKGIDWAKLDRLEKRLAPPAYQIGKLRVHYVQP